MTLKPCPFCGGQPAIDIVAGTQFGLGCCVWMEIQKSDYLTKEENATWDNVRYCYSAEAEAKVEKIAVERWNSRPTEQAAVEQERERAASIVEKHYCGSVDRHLCMCQRCRQVEEIAAAIREMT